MEIQPINDGPMCAKKQMFSTKDDQLSKRKKFVKKKILKFLRKAVIFSV